ncbi:MAG: hypothetical protein M3Z41_09160 [Candidatus Eremiobacteraeota bacterium]|nr:hypothetical protein [Candidatus Eremiobacteraeota bacterium]
MKSQQLSRRAIVFVLALLVTQAGPALLKAQPFQVPQPQSISLPIEAQAATAFTLDHYAVDARFTPAEPSSLRGPRLRRMPDHELVPAAVFNRIKAAAAHNPYAPFDQHAGPYFDQTRGPLTPAPLVKFPGLTDIDGVEPPDMAVAVSPNWVVQGVNDHWAVFSRAGAVQASWPKSFANFFHVPSPGSCDPTPFMSDPRAFYIIPDQRFVLAALQIDGAAIGTSCATLSKYWIAVSKTNNPNGVWNVYSFDMRAGTTNIADFTQIGYDANGIYFSGNMFNSAGTAYLYAEIFGAPKSKMEAGLAVTAKGFLKLKAGGILVDTVQPVDSLTQPPSTVAPQPVELFINSKNILNCTSVCNGVTVWAFANVLGTPSLTAVSVATQSYSTPPNATQPSGLTINTDDQRINGTPVYQGGLISFGLTTGITHGSSTVAGLFWGQVMPTLSGTKVTGGSIFQSGFLSFAGDRSAFYPALVPDSRGDLFIAFGSSSSTLNASAYYAGRKAADAHGTFQPSLQLLKGGTFYPGARWGDYSAAAIDGNATASQAWFALEYANSIGDWATEIGGTRFP